MKKSELSILLGIICITALIPHADSYIPPTNAIAHLKAGNGTLSPQSYDGTIQMNAGSNIQIVTYPNTNNFTISTSAGPKPASLFCSSGYQLHTYNSTSNVFTCANNNATSSAIQSINSDTTSAQTISGTTGNITITNSGTGGHTINVGSNIGLKETKVFASPTNPTGTTSTTGVMSGLGITITPKTTGIIIITVSGDMSNSIINDGVATHIRYGTGTTPSNGGALTGTVCGSGVDTTDAIAGGHVPFPLVCQVSGLTLNTQYWIDLDELAQTGGTATILNLNVSIIET